MADWRDARSAELERQLAERDAQAVWSRWWLRYFRFGPGEGLWRVLTYGRWLPISSKRQTKVGTGPGGLPSGRVCVLP
jgi:hypothetical protein